MTTLPVSRDGTLPNMGGRSAERSTDLVIVAQRSSSSGLPGYLERAFAARDSSVRIADAKSLLLPKIGPLVRSFHPDRKRWHRKRDILEFYSVEAWRRNTALNGRLLDRMASPTSTILQVGGLYFPHPAFAQMDYHLFTTYTMKLAFRDGTSPWVPEGGERNEIVALETELYRHARHIFVSAEFVKSNLTAEYGIRPERVTVVGMGVDDYYLAHPPPKPSATPTRTCLFVGYTFHLKGGPEVVQAFGLARERVEGLQLRIVGPEPSAEMTGPGIAVLGEVRDRAALLAHYREADLFLMPSHCDSYGFVFLEAMSQGAVCVGSDRNAMPEIIADGETGFIVPAGDPRRLADVIVRFYRSPALKARMGEAARARVRERHAWTAIAARMGALMR